MESKIDWSKAPEGAMVLLKHVRDDSYAWAVSHSEDARAWHKWNIRCSFHLMASMWSVVAERPTTPSWSGEGLPPVGVVCGKCYNSPSEYYNVKVLAHDDHYGEVVIYRWIEGPLEGELDQSTMHLNMASGSNAHWSFRPIRTQEQIAADDRQKMVDMLWQRYLQPILAPAQEAQVKTALGLIYDDFYRKP